MKSHKILLTIGGIAIAAALIYEIRKNYNCNITGCSKKTAAAPTTAASVTPPVVSSVTNVQPNNVVVPSTGLPGNIDDMFSPGEGFHNMDALDFPVIDPVTHYVPYLGVEQFNDTPNDAMHWGEQRLILK